MKFWGKALQTEGTASAKALMSEERQGDQYGWGRVSRGECWEMRAQRCPMPCKATLRA
jgi:hypothetical protein